MAPLQSKWFYHPSIIPPTVKRASYFASSITHDSSRRNNLSEGDISPPLIRL